MTPAPLPGDYFDKLEEEQRRRAGQPPASDQPPAPLPGDYFDKLEAKKTPPADEDAVTRWRKAHPTANVLADFAESFGSGVFNTLRGGTQLMRKYIPPIPGIIPEIPEIPESLTKHPESLAGKLGYGAEQMAEFMIPAGGVGKVSKGIDAAAQLPKVARWVGKGIAEGIPAGAISYVQSGGDTKEAATSAGATAAVTMALPVIGNMLATFWGHSSGVGDYVIKRAAAKPTPELLAAMKGEIGEGEILQLTRDAVENYAHKRSSEYVARLNQLPRQPVDIRSAVQTAAATLQDFRVSGHIDPKTGRLILDFDNAVTGNQAAKDQMQKVIDELQSPTLRHDTLGIDALKRRIDDLYREPSPARAFVAKVRDQLAQSLNTQVNGYRTMTSEYAKASDFLDNLAELSHAASNDGTAIRKLAGALKQNNDYRRQLLESLEPYAGGHDLVGQIAGSRLHPLATRGVAGPIAFGGIGAAALAGTPLATLTPASLIGLFGLSPRLVGEAAAKARIASRLVKAGTAATPGLFQKNPEDDRPTQFADGGVLNDLKRRYTLKGAR